MQVIVTALGGEVIKSEKPEFGYSKNIEIINPVLNKSIYKDKIKGFSSHEIPDEKLSASLAYAMGAKIFEKHVGIKSKKYN